MKKRFLSVLLCLCIALMLLPGTTWAAGVIDSGTCGDNLTWTLDDRGTLIISGTGDMADDFQSGYLGSLLNIESVIIQDGVTSIGNSAFNDCRRLANITIPDSVLRIGDRAFNSCPLLTSITIPNSVEHIGDSAFAYSGLVSIVVPSSVKTMGTSVFRNCDNLSSAKIYGNLQKIERATFYECNSLLSVDIPNSVTCIGNSAFSRCKSLTHIDLPSNLAEIEVSAFVECGIADISIPNNVTTIGPLAFGLCDNLADISIPESVIDIAYSAFQGDKGLSSITVNAQNPAYTSEDGVLFNKSKTTLITFPARKTGTYTIPNSVTTIEPFAFLYCEGLTNVVLPEKITAISDSTFAHCTSLTNITIPSNVSFIHNAFYGCSGLVSITIPESVTHIERNSFYACSNLIDVYYTGSQSEWASIDINEVGNNDLLNATIHYNSTGPDDPGDTGTQTASGVLRSGDNWKILWECSWKNVNGTPTDGKVDITMTGAANRTDDLYIYNENSDQGFPWELAPHSIPKSAIETLSIGGELTGKRLRIAANSFQGYSNLETVLLDDVTGIDAYAFEGCSSLKSVEFVYAAELTTIGKGAFKNCTSLSEMEIPGNLTHIGDEAFQNTALGTITLGRGVTEIGNNVFSGCRNLKIRCYDGSVAHRYAQENSIPFELIETDIGRVTVPFWAGDKIIDLDIAWEPDTLFSGTPASYNNDLAVAGLVMSWAAEDGQSRMSEVFTKLGFNESSQWHRNYSDDWYTTPAVSFAAQDITVEGKEKTLVACVVRGTRREDAGDVLTDIASISDGFLNAGRSVTGLAENYLAAFPNKDVILFVTGHSLGAATAGRVAESMRNKLPSGQVFSYAYATPRNNSLPYSQGGAIPSIHNVINQNDIVPVVPPNYLSHIGLEKYHYTQNNPVFEEAYKKYTGTPLTLWGGKIDLRNHNVDVYMALLLANAPLSVTSSYNYRLVKVLCPVDIEVIDSGNTVVGRTTNNIVDNSVSSDSVLIYVVGDEKYIYLYEDGEYSIKLTGTNDGVLNYSVEDIAIDGSVLSEKTYSNVTLALGKEMTSDVGGAIDTPDVQLFVLGDNGQPVLKVLPDGNGTEVPIEIPPECDHNYTTSVTAPTCTEQGYTTHTCSKCGDSYADTYTAALGHSYGGWRTVTAATAATSGLRERFCIRCNDRQTQSIPATGGNTTSGNDNNSSSSDPSYSIEIPTRVTGGTVKVVPTSASERQRVTVTVKANLGYKLDELIVTDQKGNELKLADKGDGKYTFTMPASKVTVDVSFAAIAEVPTSIVFTDVPSGAYYYDAVAWAVKNGVTSGTSATMFSPDSNCTRAQIVTFLWRAAGSPVMGGNSPFTDVASGSYYYDAVQWAVAQGITAGTSATTFSPEAACTRGQAVTFLYRAAGSPVAGGSSAFADVSDDAYYTNAVRWAVSKGVTAGTSTTTFSPDSNCTRAQILTFLYRNQML